MRPSLTLILTLLGAGVPAAAVEVKVYTVPAGAHPHDVAPAPDGKIWYTAQHHGALGVLDPKTRRIDEIALGAGSRPHGVITGADGAAWITDGGLNAIVRYRPESGEVTAFPLPADAGYANLNTAVFDARGMLWFTGQSGLYGRLDPATGTMKVFPAPAGAGPYGITATPTGEVYYASLAGNHIAHIDTASGHATRIDPPTPGQGARRVWSDSRGDIWVSEWNAGQLSRYQPASGSWQSWKLPGPAPRAYAVYVDGGDKVWVSDFGGNAVWRFDPDSERFTRYPGSAPGAAVRQINGRAGEVWCPESALDRLLVIIAGND